MVDIEIDDKKLAVEPGSMIIEAADAAGITIPRFCYHKKLSVAANCRMCLVEVEKAPKPLPACATPVTAGMKVFTRSAKAIDAQRSVMEFLLINHPLDCPICDQGGECELQDNSLGYGQDISRFAEGKRVVKDKDIGPLIATDMTRCIQCTRCVRFGQEIAGIRELGTIGRGENMEISTFIEHSLVSEMSGNVIDLCPVGALTSKPYRYTARAWELSQYPSIAPHDCVGSNINVHTRGAQVMRIVPRENEAVNETWISDRDRYSYTGLNSSERLTKPMIKIQGHWQETDWQTALQSVVENINKVLCQHGAQQIAAIASPSSTVEELFLLQKLWRELGSNNLDHRIHQTDVADQEYTAAYPSLNQSLTELEKCDTIFLIGSNIQREQPIIGHRIRKAFLQGANIVCLNAVDYRFNFGVANKLICHPQQLVAELAKIAIVLTATQTVPHEFTGLFGDLQAGDEHVIFAKQLLQAKQPAILLGALAQNHPQAAIIRSLAQFIGAQLHAKVGLLTDGANSAGAWLAGAIPHRLPAGVSTVAGLSSQQMFTNKLKAYLFMGVDPELDIANSGLVLAALKEAEFVVCLSAFKSIHSLQYADVLLPIAAFTETSGTYVNTEGRWQSFNGVAPPAGEARPAWKVLRVLGNLFEAKDFEYSSSEQIRAELVHLVAVMSTTEQHSCYVPEKIPVGDNALICMSEWSIYRTDSLLRQAQPLQQSATAESINVRLHPLLAANLGIVAGSRVEIIQADNKVALPAVIDEQVVEGTVLIAGGFKETATLNLSFSSISIRRLS